MSRHQSFGGDLLEALACSGEGSEKHERFAEELLRLGLVRGNDRFTFDHHVVVGKVFTFVVMSM